MESPQSPLSSKKVNRELFRKRNYTKTEWKVLELLMDCHGHTIVEVHSLLDDPLSSHTAAKMFLSQLRKKLEPFGLLIANYNQYYYLARRISREDF